MDTHEIETEFKSETVKEHIEEAVEKVEDDVKELVEDAKEIVASAIVDLQTKTPSEVADKVVEELKEKVLEDLPAIVEVVKEQGEKVLTELKKEIEVEIAESLDSCCGLPVPPVLRTLLRNFLRAQSIPEAKESTPSPSDAPCDSRSEPLTLRSPPHTSAEESKTPES